MMVEYETEELLEDVLAFLPRNLSYTEEGYLDNFSSCAQYVRPKSPQPRRCYCSFKERFGSTKTRWEKLSAIDFGQVRVRGEAGATMEVNAVSDGGQSDRVKQVPCDVLSEEGVFVNMMDDLESIESPLSHESSNSDPSYFSLDSPDEEEEVDEPMMRVLSEKVRALEDKSQLSRSLDSSVVGVLNDEDKRDLKKTSSDGNLETKFAKLKVDVGAGGSLTELESRQYLLRVPDSPVFDEPEFQVSKGELRKSSSLKTNKTPPGTPHRKKMVRFADAMGLDLESIRHVLDTDHPPKIPASAIADLKVGVEAERRDVGSRYMDLCFPQPGAMDGFLDKVMGNKIALENCIITDLSITGIVRVANIGYHKIVRVRYSINNWVTFYDVMASYVQNSCDGPTDRFSFTIVAPASFGPGAKLSFAVSYTVNDMVYWDSNGGRNYEIICYAKTTPTEFEASWMHFV